MKILIIAFHIFFVASVSSLAATIRSAEIGQIDQFGLFSSSQSGINMLTDNGGSKLVDDFGELNTNYIEFILKANRRLFSRKISIVTIRGEITRSDVTKIQSIIESFDKDKFREHLLIVDLASEGGQLIAGIELGELFSKFGVATYVGPDTKCLSACAVAFMGGAFLTDHQEIRLARGMHYSASLGFHAPFKEINEATQNDEFVTTQKKYFEYYHSGIKLIGDIISRSGARSSAWTPELLGEMLARGKDEYFFVDTIGKAKRFKIEIIFSGSLPSLLNPDTMSIEHILSTCLFELMVNSDARGGIFDASKDYHQMLAVLKSSPLEVSFDNAGNENIRDMLMVSYGVAGPSCLLGSALIDIPNDQSIYHLVGSTDASSQRSKIEGPLMDQNFGSQVVYGTPTEHAAPFNLSLKTMGEVISNCNAALNEAVDKHYAETNNLTEASQIGLKENRVCYTKKMAKQLERTQ